jgi:tRNA(Arg) A34 adenosine deaminase TadA
MRDHHSFMRRAIELARQTAMVDRAGGPFGCVIVREGAIIAEGVNRVLAENDPTCHGEVAAIRAACRALGTHDLSGCTLYSSCEPCPMCYAASWWARIDAIYYAATIADASAYGDFDDVSIYKALAMPGPARPIPAVEIDRDAMLPVWREFKDMPGRLHY